MPAVIIPELDKQIAANIKALREEHKDMSMARVARRLGMSYQSYQDLEKGKVSFRVGVLCILSDLYEVPLDAIVGDYSGFIRR